MCDIATASLVLGGLSAVSGVVGAIDEASAAKKQAKYQAQVESNNAIMAENNALIEEGRATDAKRRGLLERDALRRKIGAFEGQQLASMGGSGVTIDTGSPFDSIIDTAYLGEIDVQNTLVNAGREAYGYNVNAYNLRGEASNRKSQAGLYRMQAGNISPAMAGLSAGLAGASTVASKWDAFKKGR